MKNFLKNIIANLSAADPFALQGSGMPTVPEFPTLGDLVNTINATKKVAKYEEAIDAAHRGVNPAIDSLQNGEVIPGGYFEMMVATLVAAGWDNGVSHKVLGATCEIVIGATPDLSDENLYPTKEVLGKDVLIASRYLREYVFLAENEYLLGYSDDVHSSLLDSKESRSLATSQGIAKSCELNTMQIVFNSLIVTSPAQMMRERNKMPDLLREKLEEVNALDEVLKKLVQNSEFVREREQSRILAAKVAINATEMGGIAAILAYHSATAQKQTRRPRFLSYLGTGRRKAEDGHAWDKAIRIASEEILNQSYYGSGLLEGVVTHSSWFDLQCERGDKTSSEVIKLLLDDGVSPVLMFPPEPTEDAPEKLVIS